MDVFERLQAEWIWLPQEAEKVNQYVEFRHEFTLEEIDNTCSKLYISVDTEYAVWLNGVFVNCGQYDDYPDKKVYDILSVGALLKPGKNVLSILAYYQGENSFQYIKGLPRLIYSIEVGQFHISSGNTTFSRESQGYKCGSVDKITSQLSFSYEYTAVSNDGWLLENYQMESDWKAAALVPTLNQLGRGCFERPIKKLNIKARVQTRIITQGVFIRVPGEGKTIAQQMQTDFLSHKPQDKIFVDYTQSTLPSHDGIHINTSKIGNGQGLYVVIDLGREEAGLFELSIDADKDTILDIAYGEHLDDLRVRSAIGGRNFAARYICSQGPQEFTHYFKRIAGRYVQLHVSNIKEKFILYYAGVRPMEYPVEIKGDFHCPDHLFNKIHDISIRTLHLCMHEHYEDTPWREQALYGMDSRMQALCGYYCFGEYDFPISSFELLGNSLGDDGFIEICAPTEFFVTIPSFSMAWIMELGDYLLFSGKVEHLKALLPKVKKMLDSYLGDLDDDLMLTPDGKRYWNFYEWADGLDNCEALEGENYKGIGTRFDAPLNLFLCLALEAAQRIAEACGDLKAAKEYGVYAERIRKVFHKLFWDDKASCYKTYSGEGCPNHYSELVQALAISSGACPEAVAPIVREKLAQEDNNLVKATLSYSLYKYQALMGEPLKYGKVVFDSIAKDWGYMLYNGATSFWETIKGADDFDNAGSLSHGWSATPIYFFYAYILGVKPLEPGFKTFKVEPAYGVLNTAEGKVPTPFGDINVSWQVCDNEMKLQVKHPDEIKRV